MPNRMQEKFEIEVSGKDTDPSDWISQKRARVAKGIRSTNSVLLGTLPPGSDIEDQEISDIREQPLDLAGSSDPSGGVGKADRDRGFSRKTLSPTDDQYTREHNDLFYEDVTVDGVTGFLERGNVLDRN